MRRRSDLTPGGKRGGMSAAVRRGTPSSRGSVASLSPRSSRALHLAAAAAIVLVASLAAGCARRGGPPAIALGTPCAGCGMEVRDLRFACERRAGRDWRVYDAIECLIGDATAPPAGGAYLADYDRQSLHTAESLWVVRGEFASPMGGGFAAFLDLAAADSIAAATRGRVDRLTGFMATPAGSGR